MSKDIIYIDTEDDITSVIGKIKASTDKIVALVPPKRTGMLQSAVNLRLLARMAKTNDKKLVLVTNNKALIGLSAAAKIPVAKNLQAEPEMAEIPALEVDDGEDVIEGAQLPVGELVKTTDYTKGKDDVTDEMSSIDIDNEGPEYVPPVGGESGKPPVKPAKKSGVKIPDFVKFRKKLFLIGGGVILLVAFLIWAIWFAPAATVVITAKTDPAPVSATLKLNGTAETDINANTIQTITKQSKKDLSVTFTATGQQMLGAKATGQLTLSNASSSDPIYVPSGSVFSSSGLNFTTNNAVTVSGARLVGGNIVAGTANVNISAADVGSDYNIASGAYSSSVSGITAQGGQMSGGASHQATVVTADDIQKAGQALVALSTDSTKQDLIKQFTNGEKVIADSFTIDRAAGVSVPALNAEATGPAKLTSATTFSITAIAKSELESYLRNDINKQISTGQRIYSDGIDKVVLSNFLKNDQGSFVNVSAVGQIGPNIDTNKVKNEVKGKQFGDVQSQLQSIKGVDSVDIKFSYFWVTTVPNDDNKIDVQFVISNA